MQGSLIITDRLISGDRLAPYKALRSNPDSNAGYELEFVTNDVIPRCGGYRLSSAFLPRGKIGFNLTAKDLIAEYLGGSPIRSLRIFALLCRVFDDDNSRKLVLKYRAIDSDQGPRTIKNIRSRE